MKLKEIKKYPNESVWDFDQRFKILMEKVSFGMSDVQHKEWFIAALVPHQNVVNAAEDCNTKRSTGDHNEAGSFTCWQDWSWHE